MRSLLGRFHRPMSRGLVNNMLTMNNLGDGSTLSLDFTTGVLDSRLTFSRASTATFVNSSGYVAYAGANTAPHSESLSVGLGYSDNAILSRSTTTSPTGNTAVVFYPTIVLDYHRLQFSSPIAMAGATTISVYVKQIGSDYRAGINAFTYIGASVICSLVGAGSVVGAVGGNAPNRAATITKVTDDGWYRITLTGTYNTISSVYVFMASSTSTDSTGLNFLGVDQQGIAIWGLQVNPGSTAQTYYPTTTAAYHAPRFDYSPTNIGEPRGLLVEGSSINKIYGSESLVSSGLPINWSYAGNVTRNSTLVTSPRGSDDAVVVNETVTSGIHRVSQSSFSGYTVGAVCTFSCWAKVAKSATPRKLFVNLAGLLNSQGLFDLTATGTSGTAQATGGTAVNKATSWIKYPGDWYRVTVTGNFVAESSQFLQMNRASSTTCADDSFIGETDNGIIIWGCQLEAGSGASSYISTGASQVTRNTDSCLLSGTNFSSWFNNTEGTCLFVGDNLFVPAASNFATNWALISAANSMRINNYTRHTSGRLGASARDPVGTALTFDSPTGSPTNITTTAVYKTAFALKTNDFAYCVNGNTVGLGDASNGVFETVTSIEFARDGIRNGHTKQFKFYPTRLTEAQLQALTAP